MFINLVSGQSRIPSLLIYPTDSSLYEVTIRSAGIEQFPSVPGSVSAVLDFYCCGNK